jgi:Putative transposase, YhgA-like
MEEPKKESPKRLKDHDIFVRGIFSYQEFVLKILHYIIPKDLKPFINFDSLKILSDVHITDKLLLTQSDTIYEAELNENAFIESVRGDKNLPHFRFCFVGEFKSSKTPEPIDFQIDDYIKSVQRNDIKSGRPASIVLPILLYHGEQAWQYKRIQDHFARYLHPTILFYVNSPQYFVIDLQAMSDELIANSADLGELRAAFLALKHAQNKQYFVDNFNELLNFVEHLPTTLLLDSFVKMLLEYIERRSGLNNEKFNEVCEQSNSKFIKKMPLTASKTIFDRLEARAKKEGIKEGMALVEQKIQEANRKSVSTLISLGLTDTKIVEALDLPIAFVQAIRKEIALK